MQFITPGHISHKDVTSEAKRRGMVLTKQELKEIQNFLYDYHELYSPAVIAASEALDKIECKRREWEELRKLVF